MLRYSTDMFKSMKNDLNGIFAAVEVDGYDSSETLATLTCSLGAGLGW